MQLIHAALLAVGVLAIAFAAEIILASSPAFWLAGVLATIALLPDADLFAFVMTREPHVLALQSGRLGAGMEPCRRRVSQDAAHRMRCSGC